MPQPSVESQKTKKPKIRTDSDNLNSFTFLHFSVAFFCRNSTNFPFFYRGKNRRVLGTRRVDPRIFSQPPTRKRGEKKKGKYSWPFPAKKGGKKFSFLPIKKSLSRMERGKRSTYHIPSHIRSLCIFFSESSLSPVGFSHNRNFGQVPCLNIIINAQ